MVHYLVLFLSAGFIEFGSSIDSFTEFESTYTKEQIMYHRSLYNHQYVVPCNDEPNSCSNKIIQFPNNNDYCIINCNSVGSCDDAIIISKNCKYIHLNLKYIAHETHLQIKSNYDNDNDVILRINDKIIDVDEYNICYELLVSYTKYGEINIVCNHKSKRSLMPKTTIDPMLSSLILTATELETTKIINIDMDKELNKNKFDEEKQSLIIIIMILALFLFCVISFLIVYICSYYHKNRPIPSYFNHHQQENNNNNNEIQESPSPQTETYDEIDINGDIQLQIEESEHFVDMINDLLPVNSIGSISVIST